MKFEEPVQRINILGVGISAINLDQARDIIVDWMEHRQKHYVCVTPAHGIMDCQRDENLRKIFNSSGLTTPDGMSIVWLLKLLGNNNVGRVYGPDLMELICRNSSKNNSFRHFLYGGENGVPERLSRMLQQDNPDLKIVGTYSPPFHPLTSEEDKEIIDLINSTDPDIVWVGISTPKQERWMATHLNRVNAPILIGVGAAFDFLSGTKNQAPKWIQRTGLEWLFRLASEPKRLWKRYIQYPLFIALVLTQLLGIREFPIEKAGSNEIDSNN